MSMKMTMCEFVHGMTCKEVCEFVGSIVRCVDCKHWMDYEHEFEPNLGYCREFDREEVRDNNFCSFGERRSE